MSSDLETSQSARRNIDRPAPPALECRSLSVCHGGVPAVTDVDLAVDAGQLLALLGPSGSGKTTLLRAVAGLLVPSAGEILIDGRLVASAHEFVPPERRGAAMVFQNYALWPHLTALDNVAYPLRRHGLRKKAARASALALLERLGLAPLAHRMPAELSGGQQQRVGVARALARHGGVTLLDEPTAHLDQSSRSQVQAEIAHVLRAAGGAVVYATHDTAEALAIADHVALLRAGRVVQVGTPRDVYEKPSDVWTARLTGAASVIKGHIEGDGRPVVRPDGEPLLVRPEWAALCGDVPHDGPDRHHMLGRVADVHYRGAFTDYTLDVETGQIVVRDEGPPSLRIGATTAWSLRRAWPLATPSAADVD